ncbi:uncharacterized protein BDR25DRAFT_48394 [Lindgomyces ingoldianus]|uniref:Uncharacterized protein n=1 Tax=Lindgomyces ingoldianus TaxID=673940 RepID=A0ACB6QR61_9PLEO|nr:uncharacterized protein BDR25DRAFT_48394 [Lindgomyces ingoldianus]KAF2469352.1 hypothetical protein BDR25DRAFT_48394 [Lindgomyces ingoldianus]
MLAVPEYNHPQPKSSVDPAAHLTSRFKLPHRPIPSHPRLARQVTKHNITLFPEPIHRLSTSMPTCQPWNGFLTALGNGQPLSSDPRTCFFFEVVRAEFELFPRIHGSLRVGVRGLSHPLKTRGFYLAQSAAWLRVTNGGRQGRTLRADADADADADANLK